VKTPSPDQRSETERRTRCRRREPIDGQRIGGLDGSKRSVGGRPEASVGSARVESREAELVRECREPLLERYDLGTGGAAGAS
jgi:hypothetical protein